MQSDLSPSPVTNKSPRNETSHLQARINMQQNRSTCEPFPNRASCASLAMHAAAIAFGLNRRR